MLLSTRECWWCLTAYTVELSTYSYHHHTHYHKYTFCTTLAFQFSIQCQWEEIFCHDAITKYNIMMELGTSTS